MYDEGLAIPEDAQKAHVNGGGQFNDHLIGVGVDDNVRDIGKVLCGKILCSQRFRELRVQLTFAGRAVQRGVERVGSCLRGLIGGSRVLPTCRKPAP